MVLRGALLLFLLSAAALQVTAQETGSKPSQDPWLSGFDTPASKAEKKVEAENRKALDTDLKPSLKREAVDFGRDFLSDQKQIWTSPAQLRWYDTEWLVPIAGLTAGFLQTDASYSRHLSHNSSTVGKYNTISNAGLGAMLGGAGGMWVLGRFHGNEHWKETGRLSAEAVVNDLVLVEAMKYATRRDRPFVGNGDGQFFQPGGASFPSLHAAAAWSVAGVIAHEYPGPLTKFGAYGLAALISYSRIHARQHYPSDVFIGGLTGDMVAQNIYANRHDVELGGEVWNSFRETFHGEAAARPGNQGSPYVPLDSWVYPLLDRLIARGYAHGAIEGQKPWTRLECARIVSEAMGEDGVSSGPDSLAVDALAKEFSQDLFLLEGGENQSAHLESVYTRIEGIAGPPLTDGEHFGQTLTNDFGRPYQAGVNDVTGFSGWFTEGRWVAYSRGEYQYAPSGPAYSATVRSFIAQIDGNPVQPATPVGQTSQFQLLDAYAGMQFSNWQISYGQQSLWWGPDRTGPFLMSDNAVPIRMLHLDRTTPIILPWPLKWMGPTRLDFFFGNLQDRQFPPGPFIHGEKISFKPTENLEFGFSRTAVLGGEGRPLNLKAVWNSYVSATSGYFTSNSENPGKRTGGFDFSYRLPFIRKWATLYADAISTDDPNPIDAPRRAGITSGIYFPQIPKISHLDFRVEAGYTNIPHAVLAPGRFIYYDSYYHDLYLNKGMLIGSWIGRDGLGLQSWSRYWFDARSYLELGYRHAEVSDAFVPGGGRVNDGSVKANFWVHRNWSVSAGFQYEQWRFPILANGPQVNLSTSVGVSFSPAGGNW